ncbi:MAG: DUF2974 domain-containing protein [Ruminococcaceae bacterium]|nr:DUF2974 domain-containing protein [Oscillospiraceae bacterium]
MARSIMEYLEWRGDLNLDIVPFNEVDGVILARLSYFPFEALFGNEQKESITISNAAKAFLETAEIEENVKLKNDIELMKALIESRRFADLELINFASKLDLQSETQFSVITVCLNENLHFIAFRGTDNTLVGWKEDFNMSFVCPVPAQELAAEYLEEHAKEYKGKFILGGHSKGGNLAVYAAAFSKDETQNRIEAVYNYDGPGFDEKVLSTDGYKNICDKISTFVPESAIVGMLLGREEEHEVVSSTESAGFQQHDTYSWEVTKDGFVCLDSVDNSSKFMDYTIKAWLWGLTDTQREDFIVTVYEIMTETNAVTVQDITDNWLQSGIAMIKSYRNMNEDSREAVSEGFKMLAKSAKEGAFELLHDK